MLSAFGQDIPETVEELLRGPCALVVWDMQEGIARGATNLSALIDNIPALTAAARHRGIPVVYSQHYSVPLEFEDRIWLRTMLRRAGGDVVKVRPPYLPGSSGWQFVSETAPSAADLVLPKNRPSFFVGTPLQQVLAAKQIDVIVMTGVATDRGVLATAREAQYRGIFVVVVDDAVGSSSEEGQVHGLEELRGFADVCSTSTVLQEWGSTG